MYFKLWLLLSSLTFATKMKLSTCTDNNESLHEWAKETIKSRDTWSAAAPKSTTFMGGPVPYVIIHHTYIPAACYTSDDCEKSVKEMQRMHQDGNGWDDIGYSFAVGGDGKVYYGRGWYAQGAHAPTYNNQSIGICLIGDWRVEKPTWDMLDATKKLIELGVQLGYVAEDYKLYGHGQVRKGTECPGEALLREISKWGHWNDKPPHVFDPNATVSTSNV